eukprot:105241_1
MHIGIECGDIDCKLAGSFNFAGNKETENYSYFSKYGEKHSHDIPKGKEYSDRYGSKDKISMKLSIHGNENYCVLCFRKNDGEWKVAFDKVSKNKQIRMAVSMIGNNHVALISFEKNNCPTPTDDEEKKQKTEMAALRKELSSKERQFILLRAETDKIQK